MPTIQLLAPVYGWFKSSLQFAHNPAIIYMATDAFFIRVLVGVRAWVYCILRDVYQMKMAILQNAEVNCAWRMRILFAIEIAIYVQWVNNSAFYSNQAWTMNWIIYDLCIIIRIVIIDAQWNDYSTDSTDTEMWMNQLRLKEMFEI